MLLKYGADVNRKEVLGKTALMYAVNIPGEINVEMVGKLLIHHADVNLTDLMVRRR